MVNRTMYTEVLLLTKILDLTSIGSVPCETIEVSFLVTSAIVWWVPLEVTRRSVGISGTGAVPLRNHVGEERNHYGGLIPEVTFRSD